jgi:eukaryotic-like serine/threonine-protein kinase
MEQPRRQRIEMLFTRLADLTESQQKLTMDAFDDSDAELRAELEALLEGDRRETAAFFDTPAVEVAADVDLAPNTRVGNYELIEVIGEGGFGIVYLARQHEPIRRDVAIKIIKPGMDTRQIVRRFRDEQQTLAMLDHPNVARVLDAGATERGLPYFVMDFVRGVPITTYCRDARLDVCARLRLVLQVCDAVQHAHQKSIIHRDIKPSNILVETVDGRPLVRVIDFGIAKAIGAAGSDHTLVTEQGMMIGTPTYMSPEQTFAGGDIDTRADVYALGVLIYELLTGLLPFDPERLRKAGLSEIERIIREEEPVRPSSRIVAKSADETGASDVRPLRKLVAGDLDWIVMKAIDKDRARRYATVSDLAADIQRHLRHEPVVAGPPDTIYRVRKFVRRNRTGVVAACATLIALMVAVTGTTFGMIKARNAEADARQSADAEALARVQAEFARTEAESEALKAKTVTKFLVDTLSTANPDKSEGREPTIREVLDDAVVGLEVSLVDHPLIEADIREALGLIYKSLGRYAEALTQLKASLAIKTEYAAISDDEIAARNLDIAWVHEIKGDYPESERLARGSLATLEQLYGLEHDKTLSAMTALGASLIHQDKLEEAEAVLNNAWDARKRLFNDDNDGYGSTLSYMTDLYRAKGQLEEALPLLRELVDVLRRKYGENHSKTLSALNNLGSILKRTGRRDEAEPIQRDAMERYIRVFGEDHPRTLVVQGNYANLLRDLERFEESASLGLKTLEACKRVYGPEHRSTIIRMTGLAETYIAMERFDEGEKLYGEIMEISERVFGPANKTTLTAVHNLGWLNMDMERYDRAAELFEKAASRSEQAFSAEHWFTAAMKLAYGRALLKLERLDLAETNLLAAYDAMVVTLGPSSPRTQNAIKSLIDLYATKNDTESVELWNSRLQSE